MKPRQRLARVLACMSASRTTQHGSTCACLRKLQCDWRSRKHMRGSPPRNVSRLWAAGVVRVWSKSHATTCRRPCCVLYAIWHVASRMLQLAVEPKPTQPAAAHCRRPAAVHGPHERTRACAHTHKQKPHARAQRQTHTPTPCMHGSHTAHRLLRAIDKRPNLRERAEPIENMHLPKRQEDPSRRFRVPMQKGVRSRREFVRACVRAWGRGCVKGGAGQGWGASECRLLCAFSHSSSRLSRIASLSRALMPEAACRTIRHPARMIIPTRRRNCQLC